MIITVRDGNKPPYKVDLDRFGKEVVSFGRQSDNDIVIDALCASRLHGCFYKENGITYIEDINSTNGLYFHGNKIKRTPLKVGDAIEIVKDGAGAGVVLTCISETQTYTSQQPMAQKEYPQPSIGQSAYSSYQKQSIGQPAYAPYPQQPLTGGQLIKSKLKTNRSAGVFIFLYSAAGICVITLLMGLITLLMGLIILTLVLCGIFGIAAAIYEPIFFTELTEAVNTVAARKYSKPLTHYCLMCFVFSPLTFGIYGLVWNHQLYKRVGNEAKSRDIQTKLGPATWWILNFLLGFTIICPFIVLRRLIKTMNQICDDYNHKGF